MDVVVKITSRCNGGGTHAANYLDERTKYVDIPEENLEIYSGGFYYNLNGEEAGKLFVKEEKKLMEEKKYSHVRMVFSFSENFSKKLHKNTFQNDKTLQYITEETMSRFAEKYYGNNCNIKYIYGIHTLTDNIHSHVALLSETVDGFHVSSSSALERSDRKEMQKECFNFFRIEANKISQEIFENPPPKLYNLETVYKMALQDNENSICRKFILAYREFIDNKISIVGLIKPLKAFYNEIIKPLAAITPEMDLQEVGIGEVISPELNLNVLKGVKVNAGISEGAVATQKTSISEGIGQEIKTTVEGTESEGIKQSI